MAEAAPLDPADEELLAQVADQIVRRGLTVPAVFFLESSKPLSYVGSQALLFLEPFVRIFLSAPKYERFALLIEDRDNFERLIEGIEKRDAEVEAARRAARGAEKAAKADAGQGARAAKAANASTAQAAGRGGGRRAWSRWLPGRRTGQGRGGVRGDHGGASTEGTKEEEG